MLFRSGSTLGTALAGAAGRANAACQPPGLAAQEKAENPRSTGFLLELGKFRFLDVGDLSGPPLFTLGCPSDRIGPVDAYLVAHHGGVDAADPSLVAALAPRIAVVNNGTTKGGAPDTLSMLRAFPSTDTWQLHRSELPGATNVDEIGRAHV